MVIGADFAGFSNTHLEMLSVAFVGLAAGSAHSDAADTLLSKPAVLLFGYVLYVAAISVWNVRFPLQVIGVCLSVVLLYGIGVKCGSRGTIQRCVVDLGKYSLFAYVVQIVILQLLRRAMRGVDFTGAWPVVSFGIGVFAHDRRGPIGGGCPSSVGCRRLAGPHRVRLTLGREFEELDGASTCCRCFPDFYRVLILVRPEKAKKGSQYPGFLSFGCFWQARDTSPHWPRRSS